MSEHIDLSLALARHAVGVRFDELSQGTVASVKRSLVDAFGVALAAGTQGQVTAAFVERAAARQRQRPLPHPGPQTQRGPGCGGPRQWRHVARVGL